MIPRGGTDECLDDLSFDIDQSGDVLGIFTGEVRQQPLEIEMHVTLSGLGLQRLLIGHNECGQTVDHGVEDVRGYDAVAQQLLAPLCPCQCHLFASWICPANVGCWYGSDCIHSTLRHATGAKAGHTVGLNRSRRSQRRVTVPGSVSKVDMATPMPLIYKMLFPSISTFETP